jgi:hypothetical protein
MKTGNCCTLEEAQPSFLLNADVAYESRDYRMFVE